MANNFFRLHGLMGSMSKTKELELLRKIAYMELDVVVSERAKYAQGLFYDKFDGANEHSRAKLDRTKTTTKGAIEAGATSVEVVTTAGFQVGQEVTVYDNEKSERPTIEEIRLVDTSEVKEVVDATVINQAYDTSGNGGRKLVRLSNGWIVASAYDTANFKILFYVDKQDGNGFTFLHERLASSSLQGWATQTDGVFVYTVYTQPSANALVYYKFNGITGLGGYVLSVDTNQTSLGNVSLAINPQGTELHACWSSKNSTYPNSFNIRYAKGIINEDGTVTWGAVEQVTTANTSVTNDINPSIVLNSDGEAVILYEDTNVINKRIFATKSSNWKHVTIYNGGTNVQSSPSAIFVPSEVNGLPQGRIWVVWHGTDATDAVINNVRVSYSDDGGSTWSAMEKLTSGNKASILSPSITANKRNELFIYFGAVDESINLSSYQLKRLVKRGAVWGASELVKSSATANYQNASTLYDPTFQLDFHEPLFIYQDSQNNKVGFYGKWTEGSTEHFLDFKEPLTNSYKEKAGIARTNADIKDGELVFGTWRGQGFVIKEVN